MLQSIPIPITSRRSRSLRNINKLQMPEVNYLRYKTANWLRRAVENGALISEKFFECLEFTLGGLENLQEDLLSLLGYSPKTSNKKSDNGDSGTTRKPTTKTSTSVRLPSALSPRERSRVKKELESAQPQHLVSDIGNIWHDCQPLQSTILKLCLAKCEAVKKVPVPNSFARSQTRLEKIFGCDGDTGLLLEFVYILNDLSPVEHYFEDELEIHRGRNNQLLASVLDMSAEQLQKAVDSAHSRALLDNDYDDFFRLPTKVAMLWYVESEEKFNDLFYQKLEGETLDLVDFNLDPKNVDHIKKMLTTPGDAPVHILLYGAPGTGKTCFVNSLAKALKLPAWEMVTRESDSDKDRRNSMVAAAHLTTGHKNAFILVDEAERVLTTDMNQWGQGQDKAFLNRFLERKSQRIIWVVNDIDYLDQAVRRRFSFSQNFAKLTKKQRQKSWSRVVAQEKVDQFITSAELEKLVKRYDVSIAVITKAIRQCRNLGYPKDAFTESVQRVLEAHITLSNGGHKMKSNPHKKEKCKKEKIEVDKNYSLDAVTLQNDQDNKLETFMNNMKKLNELLKKTKSIEKGGGNILFYGPPGTGKTELARHIAHELGRKCQVKRASDLLNMYVGQTEQNIAAAFREAEKKGAVLVIDEADTFLWPRENADRSWEISQVNEFLTALEKFRGICICTSNRRENMDSAATRRFHFKIAFNFAEKKQLETLYQKILTPLCPKPLPKREKERLLACRYLAPGDFAAVRSQFWLRDKVSHQELIDALYKEQSLKPETKVKRIGF